MDLSRKDETPNKEQEGCGNTDEKNVFGAFGQDLEWMPEKLPNAFPALWRSGLLQCSDPVDLSFHGCQFVDPDLAGTFPALVEEVVEQISKSHIQDSGVMVLIITTNAMLPRGIMKYTMA